MKRFNLCLAAICMCAAALAGCSSPAPPTIAPVTFAAPPALTETDYVTSIVRADIALPPAELRAFLVANPLISFLRPQGSLSPPADTSVLSGEWPQAGAVRRMKQADGHYLVERSLGNTTERFAYQAWGFTGPAARGISYIFGEQTFVANATGGTRFTWTYRLKPKSRLTAIFVRNLRDRDIQPFLQGAVDRLTTAVELSRKSPTPIE